MTSRCRRLSYCSAEPTVDCHRYSVPLPEFFQALRVQDRFCGQFDGAGLVFGVLLEREMRGQVCAG